MFYYPESRIQLKITYNFHSRDRLGRYINIELCLPDELKKERIIGLFGSPDAISENDWMDVAAATLPITDTKWEEAFNYTVRKIGVSKMKTKTDSITSSPATMSMTLLLRT